MASQAARVLALALEPAPALEAEPTSERILDAALELAAASGLRNLTMEDVARRAGVGRMTVYRRFESKPALVDALTVRESRRCLERIAAALGPGGSAGERLATVFTATLAVTREHPLLQRLARFEPQALISELRRDDSAAFRLVREFLVGLVAEGQHSGELAGGDPEVLAELALRLGASFVLIPDSVLPLNDETSTREAVQALLSGVASGAYSEARADPPRRPGR
ncbi:MAG: TetR/AcrR family transcriptional regulator [Actinomycetota bacterium]|nr:TetR/AcrR family transcriptional regulator [Actinomycetota bacterium]